MGYVVFHINSKRNVGWKRTERGAKISVAAWNRRSKGVNYDIMEENEFNEKHNGYVTVKNMMSGNDVQIRAQDVGGPCDPSTELYHCM